ncbi:MAG TPA: F0F1 ATP synthase subunit beta [Candidatus Saccharibacteria bacterium]|nr:F0F1 ATP synthase subunit beta [Candidatus Saccharibacteria bacterium]
MKKVTKRSVRKAAKKSAKKTSPTAAKFANEHVGVISSLRGLMVEVEILDAKPSEKELLIVEGHPDVFLEVSFFRDGVVVCVNLTNDQNLRCGMKISRSHTKVTVPVGTDTLGRVFNALGEPLDKGPNVTNNRRVISEASGTKTYRGTQKLEMLETGLKVIDFLTPFVKGRKIGIVGGAGVGKTVLTMEMINNVTRNAKSLSIYCGVGERIREGNELYETLKETGVLKNTVMYFGQMDSTPAIRSMVGPAAATAAEYFRDEEGRDILFFVDNIYRHIQALTELSTNLGLIPSEGGYSPTIFAELRRLEDRLSSTDKGTITSVQAVYIPADDLSDPAVQAISQQLDSVLVLSRSVAENGIRPAVDLLKTTSSLLTPQIVGERHYKLAGQVQAIMQKYDSLKNIIAIVGENELSPADRKDYQNAQKLVQFFSQDFTVAEHLSGKPGQYFTLAQTLDGIEDILNGRTPKEYKEEKLKTKDKPAESAKKS